MQHSEIENLITLISKLPGLGSRSARRMVLHLINNKEQLMLPLAKQIADTAESIKTCQKCGNIDSVSPCYICTDVKRQHGNICVIEDVADLWAIERSHMFRGVYHVLGGTLSALDGTRPEDLSIEELVSKVANDDIDEVILATNATVDGQTTAHFITERLKPLNVSISRIAHGIPVGGELDYLDEGTLATAFNARQPF